MNNFIVKFTDNNWHETVDNQLGLTIVDVWAPWCGPCRIISPVIDELAEEFSGKVTIGKLNADENRKAAEMGVSSIPTILFLKNGREVDRVVGAVPKQTLVEKLNYHLNSEKMVNA